MRAAAHFVYGHLRPIEYRTHADRAHEACGFLHAVGFQDDVRYSDGWPPILLAHLHLPPRDTRQWFADRLSDHHLVHVAPAPILSGLERPHDGMLARPEVLRRMPVLRRVAAADVPAREAEPQMYPPIAHAQTLLAALRGGLDLDHPIEMRTRCHLGLLVLGFLGGPDRRRGRQAGGECDHRREERDRAEARHERLGDQTLERRAIARWDRLG